MNKIIGLTLIVVFFSGCALEGRLFSNTVAPLSSDFNNTPVGLKKCVIKNYRVREPVSRLNVSAEWSRGYVAEQAREAGIENIYYMDVRVLSFLLGIYRRKDLIIYGD